MVFYVKFYRVLLLYLFLQLKKSLQPDFFALLRIICQLVDLSFLQLFECDSGRNYVLLANYLFHEESSV